MKIEHSVNHIETLLEYVIYVLWFFEQLPQFEIHFQVLQHILLILLLMLFRKTSHFWSALMSYSDLYWNAFIQATPVAGEYFSFSINFNYTSSLGLARRNYFLFTLLRSLVNSSLSLTKQRTTENIKKEKSVA